MAAQPRERIGQHRAHHGRDRDAGQQPEPCIDAQLHVEQRGRVRAHPEEHLRPEVELPRPPTDPHVQPRPSIGIDQHQEAHRLVVRGARIWRGMG